MSRRTNRMTRLWSMLSLAALSAPLAGGQAALAGTPANGAAPAAASVRHVAAPMPLAPPVIRAIRPSKRNGVAIPRILSRGAVCRHPD